MPLRVLPPAKLCSMSAGPCTCTAGTPCPGYGTSAVCPPLIVLAVAAQAQTMLGVAR